jgi:hypothetical protein
MLHPSAPRHVSHRNGYALFAFRPRADPVFVSAAPCMWAVCAWSHASAPPAHAQFHPSAPGSTRPHRFPCVRARRVCARIRGRTKNPYPVPRVHAWNSRPFPPVRTRSHPPAPLSMHPRPTRSRFYQRAHAPNRMGDQCMQPFPASAPSNRVHPQQYINPLAPPHKSLYS